MDMFKGRKGPCNSAALRARKEQRRVEAAERQAKYDAIPLVQKLSLPNRGAKETAKLLARIKAG